MSFVRIRDVEALDGFRLRLTLTDGRVIERDVQNYLRGPLFESIRRDQLLFAQVEARDDSVAWPNGADLCPDLLIWNGPPPESKSSMQERVSSAKAYRSETP